MKKWLIGSVKALHAVAGPLALLLVAVGEPECAAVLARVAGAPPLVAPLNPVP